VALDGGLRFFGLSARPPAVGASTLVAIRPERIQLNPSGETLENLVAGTVIETIYLGDHTTVRVRAEGGPELTANGGVDSVDEPPARGMPLKVGWKREHCLLLDAE
jgi:putative spermidine/putrescine transport system ATP-binding protein